MGRCAASSPVFLTFVSVSPAPNSSSPRCHLALSEHKDETSHLLGIFPRGLVQPHPLQGRSHQGLALRLLNPFVSSKWITLPCQTSVPEQTTLILSFLPCLFYFGLIRPPCPCIPSLHVTLIKYLPRLSAGVPCLILRSVPGVGLGSWASGQAALPFGVLSGLHYIPKRNQMLRAQSLVHVSGCPVIAGQMQPCNPVHPCQSIPTLPH